MNEQVSQPLPVKGYTPQKETAIRRVNLNKEVEELVLRLIDNHGEAHAQGKEPIDMRMTALARTHIETAFMFLNRAVLHPGRITGEIDLSSYPNIETVLTGEEQ